ncbi:MULTISPECIES: SH3 domain-containing protein [Rhodomicrobium]|uniref:SH3 domain-containing protein n=1 Tax=Rhodomicrobium TaxID=1068 RepID=UPI000B4BF6E3|nr:MULTISPECIES: SH3 domain-containing protein [Rhodomicrobium]
MIVRRGLAKLAAVSLPLFGALMAAAPGGAVAETWRAANLNSEARIHLRTHPNNRAKILAYIPGDARGLEGGACSGNWCPIEFRGMNGWVYRHFIEPDDDDDADTEAAAKPKPAPAAAPLLSESEPVLGAGLKKPLQLVSTDGRPIPIYAFPNDALPVAGRLSADTAVVEGLGSCIRTWCNVRAGELVGWISNSNLKPEDAALAHESTAALAPAEPEDKSLSRTLPTAALGPALAKPLGDTDTKTYTLAGLAGQSSLPMRAEPGSSAAIVAWIPNDAKDVEGLRKCVDSWCLVRYGESTGWVARRHLADAAIEASQSFQVSGLALWNALDVLDYPNPNAVVVGQIPAYATGIVPIGGCDDDWCHIRYLGIAGWVRASHLEPQKK